MTNIDKLNKSMECLISTLYDITDSINSATNYDEIDINMSTVDKLTTNIKRMVDAGVSLNGGSIQAPKPMVGQKENQPIENNKEGVK